MLCPRYNGPHTRLSVTNTVSYIFFICQIRYAHCQPCFKGDHGLTMITFTVNKYIFLYVRSGMLIVSLVLRVIMV